MRGETVEARAVKIAAKVMTAAGLCRYEDPCARPPHSSIARFATGAFAHGC